MTMMTAGRPEAYARCQGVLDAMAAKVYRLGDRAGAGSKVKIINQLLAGVHIAAAAEAMALGLREGVDAAALYEVITHSAGNSWMFENRMAHVLAGDYTPLSAVDIFVKDLGLVLDMARASKFPLPLSSTAHQMFMQASSAGFAKEDDSAVIKIFPGIDLPENETMSSKLGCIADDFTGATDLANNLVRAGMRTVQVIGVPERGSPTPADADAVVVALKSRTAPVAEAVAQSLAAARWLRAQGAAQIYFKVCSTFDSTPAGNIGPVTEALMDELQADFVVITPGLPRERAHRLQGPPVRRRPAAVRQLDEQPPADADDRRQPGARDAGAARRGAGAQGRPDRLPLRGPRCRGDPPAHRGAALPRHVRMAVVDALDDDDLRRLAAASAALPLVVAGSGLAIGIPALHGLTARRVRPPGCRRAAARTRGVVRQLLGRHQRAGRGLHRGRWRRLCRGPAATGIGPQPGRRRAGLGRSRAWPRRRCWSMPRPSRPRCARCRQQLGAEHAGALVETRCRASPWAWSAPACGQLIVAGGETSGACVQALGITQLRIGAQIDPGVPWCHAATPTRADGLHLALKSGNFGGIDFFSRAFTLL